MSDRNVFLFVLDMPEAIEKIERYTSGQTYETFVAHDLILDAVVRNLEIIGEAARHIPEELRRKYPEIDWRRVVGFRNAEGTRSPSGFAGPRGALKNGTTGMLYTCNNRGLMSGIRAEDPVINLTSGTTSRMYP